MMRGGNNLITGFMPKEWIILNNNITHCSLVKYFNSYYKNRKKNKLNKLKIIFQLKMHVINEQSPKFSNM